MAVAPIRLGMRLRVRRSLLDRAAQVFSGSAKADILTRVIDHKRKTLMPAQWRGSQSEWKPLTLTYRNWKAAHGLYREIWRRTGAVMYAVTGRGAIRPLPDGTMPPAQEGQVVVRQENGGVRTTVRFDLPAAVDYWQYVEEGTPKMPARPWISFREEDMAEIQQKIVLPWIKRNAEELQRAMGEIPLLTVYEADAQ